MEGIQVAMKVTILVAPLYYHLNNSFTKSDYTARHLLYEAQQAYFYGLPANLALLSITTIPSVVLGLDHRLGLIRPGISV